MCRVAQEVFTLIDCSGKVPWLVTGSEDLSEPVWGAWMVLKPSPFLPASKVKAHFSNVCLLHLSSTKRCCPAFKSSD